MKANLELLRSQIEAQPDPDQNSFGGHDREKALNNIINQNTVIFILTLGETFLSQQRR